MSGHRSFRADFKVGLLVTTGSSRDTGSLKFSNTLTSDLFGKTADDYDRRRKKLHVMTRLGAGNRGVYE
jgi:hypothetical protein